MSKTLFIFYFVVILNCITGLQWTTQTLDEAFSSSISFVDDHGNFWRCGGKMMESDSTTIQHACRSLNFGLNSWSEVSTDKGIKQSTSFPGFYTLVKGYFSEVQNKGGYYGGKGCMIGLNDATNSAKCYCCNFDASQSNYICDSLTNNNNNCQTKVFGQCVTPDNGRLMEIGGASGSVKNSNIKAFSLKEEKYVSHEYGSLEYAVSNHGCTMTSDGKIVIVGGETDTESFQTMVQVCPRNQDCYVLGTQLNEGIEKTRCTSTADKNVVVCMGGRSNSGIVDTVMIIDINKNTIDYDTLPTGLVEFNIYIDENKLCLVDGIQLDGNKAGIDSKVYCTPNLYSSVVGGSGQDLPPSTAKPTTANPTNKPTNKPTTSSPTRRPTNKPTNPPTTVKPTKNPTKMPTPAPTQASKEKITLNALSLTAEYEKGRESQICASDSSRIYHFGGITEDFRDTNEFLAFNSNLQDSHEYSVVQKSNSLWTTSMNTLYCKHQCSVMHEETKSMFIVSPIVPIAANSVYFYKCKVDSAGQHTLCFDICRYNGDQEKSVAKSYCPNNNLKYFNPCVTSFGSYLIIIGGYSGNTLFDGIVVYDMYRGEFLSSSQKKEAGLDFGSLYKGVKAASCAMWDNKIYVFGGIEYATGNTPSSLIQICESGKDCYESPAELKVPRFDSKAVVLGSEIVITCGNGESYKPIGEIEIYDCEFDTIKAAPFQLQQPTSHCCLNTINNLIVVSGGSSLQLNGLKDIYSTPFELAPEGEILLKDCQEITISNTNDAAIVDNFFGVYAYDKSIRIPGYSIWINQNGYGTGIFYSPAIPAVYIGGNNNIWFAEITGNFDTSDKYISIAPTYPTNRYYSFKLECTKSRRIENDKDNDTPLNLELWLFILIVILLSIFIIGISGLMIYYFMKIKNNDFYKSPNKNIVQFRVKSTSQNVYRSTTPHGGLEKEPLSPRMNTFSDNTRTGGYTPNVLFGDTTNENYQKDVDMALEQQENSDTDVRNVNEVQLDRGYEMEEPEEDTTTRQITPNVLFGESQL